MMKEKKERRKIIIIRILQLLCFKRLGGVPLSTFTFRLSHTLSLQSFTQFHHLSYHHCHCHRRHCHPPFPIYLSRLLHISISIQTHKHILSLFLPPTFHSLIRIPPLYLHPSHIITSQINKRLIHNNSRFLRRRTGRQLTLRRSGEALWTIPTRRVGSGLPGRGTRRLGWYRLRLWPVLLLLLLWGSLLLRWLLRYRCRIGGVWPVRLL